MESNSQKLKIDYVVYPEIQEFCPNVQKEGTQKRNYIRGLQFPPLLQPNSLSLIVKYFAILYGMKLLFEKSSPLLNLKKKRLREIFL